MEKSDQTANVTSKQSEGLYVGEMACLAEVCMLQVLFFLVADGFLLLMSSY